MTVSQIRKTAQKEAAKKRPQTWKEGKSGNPGGRKKNEVSLTAIARRYLSMSPAAIGNEIKALSSRYKALGVGDGATMAEYIIGSFLYAVANDPQPGNMRELWRRVDGEVASLNIDVSTLTDDQLERLANGEDVYSVLAHRGDGGTRAAQENEREDQSSES